MPDTRDEELRKQGPYKFQAFPKMLHKGVGTTKQTVIVTNEAEEKVQLGKGFTATPEHDFEAAKSASNPDGAPPDVRKPKKGD